MSRYTTLMCATVVLFCLPGGSTGSSSMPRQTGNPKPRFEPTEPISRTPVMDKLAEEWSADARPDANVHIPRNHPIHKKWPNLKSGVLSPNGKTAAIYTGKEVYLVDSRGGHARRLEIKLLDKVTNPHVSVSFSFRRDSSRVAILTTLVYGEPLGAYIERLYTANAATGRVTRLAAWAGRVQGSGPQTADRELAGWTSDGKSIKLTGVVYNGEEMPTDARKIGIEHIVVKDAPPKRP